MASDLVSAVQRSIEARTSSDLDAAVEELALTYALLIASDPELAPKVGPALLATLDALSLTPRSRAAAAGKGGGDTPRDTPQPVRNPVDEVRKRRETRQRPA